MGRFGAELELEREEKQEPPYGIVWALVHGASGESFEQSQSQNR
jgi:hypothetical protein